MVHSIRTVVLLSLLISSCITSSKILSRTGKVNQIVISSTNLSEDASILSTNVDELLLLAFCFVDNRPTDSLVQETFTFDKENRTHTSQIDSTSWTTPILLALVELDSNEPAERVSDQVKKHHEILSKAYKRHDLATIESMLKDDDLLGIQIIDSKVQKVNFYGTWRMDRYEYQISLVAHQ